MLKSKLSYTNSLCIITAAALAARSYISKKTDEKNDIARQHQQAADHYKLCESVIEKHFHEAYRLN